jgi:hypothetical protein
MAGLGVERSGTPGSTLSPASRTEEGDARLYAEARGAAGSIKPGAQAPGSVPTNDVKPAKWATALAITNRQS